MKLCSDSCVPCCDFCVHCIHENVNGMVCEPIGCKLHPEEKYQLKAQCCGSCEDFHCFRHEKLK